MKKPVITVVGSVNNDLIIEVNNPPVMGETTLGKGFMQAPGGKGANQAVAAARLGAETAFVGAVGNDIFGAQMKKGLEDNRVNVEGLKITAAYPTGTAMIVICDGNNYIAVDQGANLTVDKRQIDSAERFLKDADMVILQFEIPFETVCYAIEKCNSFGVPVLLNPAPVPSTFFESEILSKIDLLTPNETEAFALTGIMPDTPEEAVRSAKRLAEMGARRVVITMGGGGCIYGEGLYYKHLPAFNRGQAVDTTAAGDSFTAALAVAFAEGKGFEEAVIFASNVGAVTVTKKGSQPSLPYRNEL